MRHQYEARARQQQQQRPANVSRHSIPRGLKRKFHDHCSAHAVTLDSATASRSRKAHNDRRELCNRQESGAKETHDCTTRRKAAHSSHHRNRSHATTSPALLKLPQNYRHDCHVAGFVIMEDPSLHELDHLNPAPPVISPLSHLTSAVTSRDNDQ